MESRHIKSSSSSTRHPHEAQKKRSKKSEAKQALTTRAGADPGPLNECILGILGIYIYDVFLDWCFL
jgi:hypothetical protein